MTAEATKEKKATKALAKPVSAPRAGGKPAAKKAPAKKAPAKAAAKTDDFSVIETGGKQYVVSVGDVLEVELLGAHKEGDKIEFDKVLMNDDGKSATIGDPYIKGAKVKATFLGEKKGKKLSIIRYKAKSNRDRKIGHRQQYARVEITAI